jgi:hypothetical protein
MEGFTCEWGRMNGDESEGMWTMGFVYIYEMEQ